MAVTHEHLVSLYATTDDPWDFRGSAYEIARFTATLAALPDRRYAHALELGCGNGELVQRIAHRCDAYTGLDAVETALAVARIAVPDGRCVQGFLPCALPAETYDLIVQSEILYFLDATGLSKLAQQLDAEWPETDGLHGLGRRRLQPPVVCVGELREAWPTRLPPVAVNSTGYPAGHSSHTTPY